MASYQFTMRFFHVGLLAVFVLLLTVPAYADTSGAADQSDVRPLATHLAYRLAGSGQWRTPNPDYDPEDPNSPRQFGIDLAWAEGNQHVVGKVTGITDDGRIALYQTLLLILDPAGREVVVQQVGWDGAFAEGRQPLRRRPLEAGDVDRLDLEIAAADGSTLALRHEDKIIDDDRYRSVVYERRDGEWVPSREWLWTRVAKESAIAGAGECGDDCPILEKEILVHAPLERVWRAWTTNEGLEFISAKSNVQLEVGGPYEWFLDGPADANGFRGSERSRVRAFVPERMLAFDWTFSPETPGLRAAGATTTVIVVFDEVAGDTVHVRLLAVGWQAGAEWRQGWRYFDGAWQAVLARLKSELE